MENSCEVVVQKRDNSAFSCNSLFIICLYCLQGIKHGRESSFIDPARELKCVGSRKDVSVLNALIIERLVISKLRGKYWEGVTSSRTSCVQKKPAGKEPTGVTKVHIYYTSKMMWTQCGRNNLFFVFFILFVKSFEA